jgi:hypothetical protein
MPNRQAINRRLGISITHQGSKVDVKLKNPSIEILTKLIDNENTNAGIN